MDGGENAITMDTRSERFVMTGEKIIKIKSVPAAPASGSTSTARSREFSPTTAVSAGSYILDTEAPVSSSNRKTSPHKWIGKGNTRKLNGGGGNDVLPETGFSCKENVVLEISPLRQSSDTERLEILGCPRFPDMPVELDIPPDDISSEDERYCRTDDVDVDELPPPPDDLLGDFVQPQPQRIGPAARKLQGFVRRFDSEDDKRQLSPPPSAKSYSCNEVFAMPDILTKNTNYANSSSDQFSDGSGEDSFPEFSFQSSDGLAIRSVEKLAFVRSPINGMDRMQDASAKVRSSKSHESHLQCSLENEDGGRIMSFEIEDSIGATSVDVLHRERHTAVTSSTGRHRAAAGGDSTTHSAGNLVDKHTELSPSHGHLSRDKKSSGSPSASKKKARDQNSAKYGSPSYDPRTSSEFVSVTDDSVYNLELGDSCEPLHCSDNVPLFLSAETTYSEHSIVNDENVMVRSPARKVKETDLNGMDISSTDTVVSNVPRLVPPAPEDDLFRVPAKDVDRPSACRLAKRLYNLDGFQKSDVSKHLSKKNDFSFVVGAEYLAYFELAGLTLDAALRTFLQHLILSGETQERERILAHFSRRYLQCNPNSFKSEDSCHTLTCAMMLLNTDLHRQNAGRKMTINEFIDNLADLNDGENFPREVLRAIYHSIRDEAIEFDIEELETSEQQAAFTIGSNPFLDVPDPSKTKEFKKGYVMRKCCIEPDGRRTPLGRRGWKMLYATLLDMVLYMHKDDNGFKRSTAYSAANAIRVHHAIATPAEDYMKKQHVLKLQTSDWAQYLLQTSDAKECREWIDAINYVSAAYSAPPLPSPCGSQKKFQRPLMPSSYTKLTMKDQLTSHQTTLDQIEQDLIDHGRCSPDKGSKSRIIQDFVEKETFLLHERKRFKIYCEVLEAKLASELDHLEVSLMDVAIGEVDEPHSSPQIQRIPLATTSSVEDPQLPQRSLSDRYSYRAAIYPQQQNEIESEHL